MAKKTTRTAKQLEDELRATIVGSVIFGAVAVIGIILCLAQSHNVHGPAGAAINMAGWGTIIFLGLLRHLSKVRAAVAEIRKTTTTPH